MKDRIWRLPPCPPYDVEGMESWLSDMAAQGWKLEPDDFFFGIASFLIFQILINVGMCIGVFPVVGLTLPFVSAGGSSIITLYLAMGLVSGIHMRPDPDSKSPYIQPRY